MGPILFIFFITNGVTISHNGMCRKKLKTAEKHCTIINHFWYSSLTGSHEKWREWKHRIFDAYFVFLLQLHGRSCWQYQMFCLWCYTLPYMWTNIDIFFCSLFVHNWKSSLYWIHRHLCGVLTVKLCTMYNNIKPISEIIERNETSWVNIWKSLFYFKTKLRNMYQYKILVVK